MKLLVSWLYLWPPSCIMNLCPCFQSFPSSYKQALGLVLGLLLTLLIHPVTSCMLIALEFLSPSLPFRRSSRLVESPGTLTLACESLAGTSNLTSPKLNFWISPTSNLHIWYRSSHLVLRSDTGSHSEFFTSHRKPSASKSFYVYFQTYLKSIYFFPFQFKLPSFTWSVILISFFFS